VLHNLLEIWPLAGIKKIFPVLAAILDFPAILDFFKKKIYCLKKILTTNIQLTASKKCKNHPLDGQNIFFLFKKR
jgi:hypothetical protein